MDLVFISQVFTAVFYALVIGLPIFAVLALLYVITSINKGGQRRKTLDQFGIKTDEEK